MTLAHSSHFVDQLTLLVRGRQRHTLCCAVELPEQEETLAFGFRNLDDESAFGKVLVMETHSNRRHWLKKPFHSVLHSARPLLSSWRSSSAALSTSKAALSRRPNGFWTDAGFLDIGCGKGLSGVHASKLGTEGGIIGVDISAASLPLAMAKGYCENAVVGHLDEPLVSVTNTHSARHTLPVQHCTATDHSLFRSRFQLVAQDQAPGHSSDAI